MLWHGGDYSPEQWAPETWDEDVRLMREARFRVATLGVFSWAALEPAEGRFEFGWLDGVIERLAAADRFFILATPSAAPPAWMARAYPEILRTGPDRVRRLHGNRVNYSLGSPLYRERTRDVARRLAERYGDHPRLLAWHVSNEYGGADYGPDSLAAFRLWLRDRYGSLDALNAAYWTAFWSHAYADWEEIDAPGAPHGETAVPGLTVDWQRFVTAQTVDFMLNEAAPLREISPDVPLTTNFMGTYPGLDYRKFAPHLDFACWDSYPAFGAPLQDTAAWVDAAFKHDLTRGLDPNGRWMLMECSPSSSNWYPTMTLKRPGCTGSRPCRRSPTGRTGCSTSSGASRAEARSSTTGRSSITARRRTGACSGRSARSEWNWRGWRASPEPGSRPRSRSSTTGRRAGRSTPPADRSRARKATSAPRSPTTGPSGRRASPWTSSAPTRTCRPTASSSRRWRTACRRGSPRAWPGTSRGAGRSSRPTSRAGRTRAASSSRRVSSGRCAGCWGLWSEELDALGEGAANAVRVAGLGMDGSYAAGTFCELVHLTTATALGVYEGDFYAGRPALTVNRHGQGRAYYVASRNEAAFTDAFLRAVAHEAGVQPLVEDLPPGVTAQRRVGETEEHVFLMNATPPRGAGDRSGTSRQRGHLGPMDGLGTTDRFGTVPRPLLDARFHCQREA